jgi:hypothetical protein
MDQFIALYYVATLLAAWRVYRRSAKEDALRIEHLAAANLRICTRNTEMIVEITELLEERESMLGLAHLLEETNYRLACKAYGKAAVDESIRANGKSARN